MPRIYLFDSFLNSRKQACINPELAAFSRVRRFFIHQTVLPSQIPWDPPLRARHLLNLCFFKWVVRLTSRSSLTLVSSCWGKSFLLSFSEGHSVKQGITGRMITVLYRKEWFVPAVSSMQECVYSSDIHFRDLISLTWMQSLEPVANSLVSQKLPEVTKDKPWAGTYTTSSSSYLVHEVISLEGREEGVWLQPFLAKYCFLQQRGEVGDVQTKKEKAAREIYSYLYCFLGLL